MFLSTFATLHLGAMLSIFHARCETEGCEAYAIGDDTLCGGCDKILCRGHFDDIEHACRYTSNEVRALCIHDKWDKQLISVGYVVDTSESYQYWAK